MEPTKSGTTCPECGVFVEDDQRPVDLGGWHGDVRYSWLDGKCIAVEVACPHCGYRSKCQPTDDFDEVLVWPYE